MANKLHLITVGKLKGHLKDFEDNFYKRLTRPLLYVHETKAFSEHPDQEAKEVLKKAEEISAHGDYHLYLLDEAGTSFNSIELSHWLETELTKANHLIFCIGGAYGHHESLYKNAVGTISLSPLTLTHQMARVIFIEQYYRVQTIWKGHPYHNG